MQSAKKKVNNNTNTGGRSKHQEQVGKQKERHIVSWSQEEDDILREQIRVHGSENWAIIASKFKDKTTRQCRRRWFTYLNSDFKKGGWSPEEDLLLCEAQKIFGNRWTEIAKVVSGRTDNAVKNRFSTLCKKRAKREALAKENNTSYINLNNKRVIFPTTVNADGTSEAGREPLKKIRRSHLPSSNENCKHEVGECGSDTQTLRPPFAVLPHNKKNGGSVSNEQSVNNIKEVPSDGNSKNQETFIKKDDPKVLALLQQAELLSSLAAKVNFENTEQSLENAWKVLQDFLNQNKESDELCFTESDMDYHLETIKDLIEDLQGSDGGSHPSWRGPDLYEETSGSPELSTTGSTPRNLMPLDKTDQSHSEFHAQFQSVEPDIQSTQAGDNHGLKEGENHVPVIEPSSAQEKIPPVDDDLKANDLAACGFSNMEFNSPVQETPVFKSIAAAIPSPKFSESERHFLLKALGRDSASCFINPSAHLSQPPACKRALLRSL